MKASSHKGWYWIGVDAVELFKKHSGKYQCNLEEAGMFRPHIIAAYGRMGWCLNRYDEDQLIAVIIGYPVGSSDYEQVGHVVGINEDGEYFYVWACITHPDHRGNTYEMYKEMIKTRWPKVKYAYGHRNYRKTRFFKE